MENLQKSFSVGVTLATVILAVTLAVAMVTLFWGIVQLLMFGCTLAGVLCGASVCIRFIAEQTTQAGESIYRLRAAKRTTLPEIIMSPGTHVLSTRTLNGLDLHYVPSPQRAAQLAAPLPLSAERSASPVLTGDCLSLSESYAAEPDEFLSARKLIVGVSGAGKSNSVGVMVEELGRLGVPMILADTEDEYESIASYLPNGVLADASTLHVENAGAFARTVLTKCQQVILNLQSYVFEEAAALLVALVEGLRSWQEERANDKRIPCEFILEEATTWLPQNQRESPLHGTPGFARLQDAFFNDLVRKGRKRGLGLTVVCQKIAEIDKRALQADVKILHRQTELNDLARYAQMGITKQETLSLGKGECYYFSATQSKQRMQIRRRNSPHGANTPGLAALRTFRGMEDAFELDGEAFEPRLELVRPENSDVREFEREPANPPDRIPSELRTRILDLYRVGTGRKGIQSLLSLNGDEYWMIREVCNAYDADAREEDARNE